MPKKLLVADDSVTIQKLVSLSFAGEDVVIEAVGNGDQAIEKIRELRPDIVLADVFMPGCNGYEICATIKGDEELSKIPVVLLVGTFEPFDEIEASRVRCDAHLTKPFDTSELLQVVHSLLEGEALETRQAAAEKAMDVVGEDETLPTGTAPEEPHSDKSPIQIVPGLRLVSDRTRESFLGPRRVLDLIGLSDIVVPSPALAPAPVSIAAEGTPPVFTATAPKSKPAIGPPGIELSEDVLNAIVERVIKRISPDVVREVAWEVVPELSEMIIRQCLQEKSKI